MHDLNKPQCSKLPPHLHRQLDLLLPFFFFLFFPSSRLLSFSTALISSLFCWTMNIAMWFLFLCFVSYLKFPKLFYTWLALEMLKTYIFFNKIWAEWFSHYFFFSFEPHVMWCINCITSIEPYSSFFFFNFK